MEGSVAVGEENQVISKGQVAWLKVMVATF